LARVNRKEWQFKPYAYGAEVLLPEFTRMGAEDKALDVG
jgi:hypothetical protein